MKRPATTRYIALEGGDGSGKTTLSAALAAKLRALGDEVVEVREPGGTPLGETVRELVLDSDRVDRWAEVFLFAAQRAQLARDVVAPALERGAWVISDRTYYSSIAYQGRARGMGEERVREINEIGLEGLEPGRVFVIDVDPGKALSRQGRPDRIGSESVAFQEDVAAAYRDLAVAEPERVVLLDGSGSTEELVDRVMSELGMMTDSFDGVIGHERVVELLRREVSAPAQAYLFTGPDSVGKATLAARFAAALLCAEGGEHDVECRSCRLVREGVHPDVTVVEPEGATSLGVDQAREVVTRSSLRPVESDRSVFLFPEAGTMTEQAANALLKTLEEPTASVVFLLVAESEDDFPATVASRCRTIHIGRVPQETMVAALEARGLDRAAAEGVAVVSGGRPGLALALMDRPEVSRFRDLWLAIPGQVTPHPGDGQRLASDVLSEIAPLVDQSVSDDMTKEREQRARRRAEQSLLVNGLEILASWYTDSASLQMGGPVRNSDLPLGTFTDVSPRKAVASAEKILDAVVDIQANLRRELVLANLFAGLGSET